jgi:hypothetical protein
MRDEALGKDLSELSRLLHKYGHNGQARVVDGIVASLEVHPDYKCLAGIDMWGGSGAVWEVSLAPSGALGEHRADEKSFRELVIRIAAAMDRLGIGTERSRHIAKVFRGWLDKGV